MLAIKRKRKNFQERRGGRVKFFSFFSRNRSKCGISSSNTPGSSNTCIRNSLLRKNTLLNSDFFPIKFLQFKVVLKKVFFHSKPIDKIPDFFFKHKSKKLACMTIEEIQKLKAFSFFDKCKPVTNQVSLDASRLPPSRNLK